MSDNNRKSSPPVVQYLKQASEISQIIHELPGVAKFRVVPVSVSLIEDVGGMIKDPEVPMWENPDKDGRKEPNPSDPEYLAELAIARRRRNAAIMDAMVMMGVELVDGVPDSDLWVPKLLQLERRHLLSLEEFDLEDEIDLEFLYKRYIVSSGEVVELISRASGAAEQIREAEDSFPGN